MDPKISVTLALISTVVPNILVIHSMLFEMRTILSVNVNFITEDVNAVLCVGLSAAFTSRFNGSVFLLFPSKVVFKLL